MSTFNLSILGLQTGRSFNNATAITNQALRRLSTGLRINRGADDPAGLISSERLKAELRTLEAETRIAQRTDSVAATADAALSTVNDQLGRAQEIAVTASNSFVTSEERAALQSELDSISQSVNRTLQNAEFNGQKLFNGEVTLSVGGGSLSLDQLSSSNLGETTINAEELALSDVESAGALALSSGRGEDLQTVIGAAIDEISTVRGQIGNFQRNIVRPEIARTQTAFENVSAANSIIADADFARETSVLTRGQILRTSSATLFGGEQRSASNAFSLLFGG